MTDAEKYGDEGALEFFGIAGFEFCDATWGGTIFSANSDDGVYVVDVLVDNDENPVCKVSLLRNDDLMAPLKEKKAKSWDEAVLIADGFLASVK